MEDRLFQKILSLYFTVPTRQPIASSTRAVLIGCLCKLKQVKASAVVVTRLMSSEEVVGKSFQLSAAKPNTFRDQLAWVTAFEPGKPRHRMHLGKIS